MAVRVEQVLTDKVHLASSPPDSFPGVATVGGGRRSCVPDVSFVIHGPG